jgi:hypothetical protein
MLTKENDPRCREHLLRAALNNTKKASCVLVGTG